MTYRYPNLHTILAVLCHAYNVLIWVYLIAFAGLIAMTKYLGEQYKQWTSTERYMLFNLNIYTYSASHTG